MTGATEALDDYLAPRGRGPDPAPAAVPAAQARPWARRRLRPRRGRGRLHRHRGRAVAARGSGRRRWRPAPRSRSSRSTPSSRTWTPSWRRPSTPTSRPPSSRPPARSTTCRPSGPSGRRRRTRPVQARGPVRAPLPAALRGTGGGRRAATRTCTLVAKLYREIYEAQAADDLLARLRERAAVAWTARPLGVVPGLPLALTEDLGSSRDPCRRTPACTSCIPGPTTRLEVVRRAARALAELHTSGLDSGGLSRRTGADEAGKAAKRARLLEQYVPELAPVVRAGREALCATLAGLPTDTLRPGARELQGESADRPGRRRLPRGLRPVLPGRPRARRRVLPGLPAARRALVPPGRAAGVVEEAAEVFVSTYLERLAERGEAAATCAGIGGRATCSRRRCCSRSPRAGRTGCTAPGPERLMRCSTRSPPSAAGTTAVRGAGLSRRCSAPTACRRRGW